MVRRAFRGAFSPDELDDIYAGAWVGTLRALADRQAGLADDEIRSYVLTAVANQAGKEIRRRKRKPTAPLESVGTMADDRSSPEELAASAEQSRVTRDLLSSLPARRRAVMLLRYGWGLEPSQVCGLIKGLSPRAYRKEITRGVDELTERMRAVERGSWCADRESVLKAFAAGLADDEQERQARAHLAHCRHCAEFVGRLTGHLHDLGGAVASVGAIDAIDSHVGLGDRIVDLGDRAAGLVARGGSTSVDSGTGQLAASGGARGAGAAGAGVLAKLAGLGTAGKIVLACAGGGMAATACVAAGVSPFGIGGDKDDVSPPPRERHAAPIKAPEPKGPAVVHVETLPSQIGHEWVPPPPPDPQPGGQATVTTEPAPAAPAPEAAPVEPTVAPTAPPTEQEFSVSSAAVAPPSSSPLPHPVGRQNPRVLPTSARSSDRERPRAKSARGSARGWRPLRRRLRRRRPPAASTTSSSATRGISRPTRSRRPAGTRATPRSTNATAASRTDTSGSTTSGPRETRPTSS